MLAKLVDEKVDVVERVDGVYEVDEVYKVYVVVWFRLRDIASTINHLTLPYLTLTFSGLWL